MEGANNQVDYNDLSLVVIQLLELKNFLEYLQSEGRLEEFLEEKMEEFDDSLNNLEYLLHLIYLFTYEAGLAIIKDIRDCIDIDYDI